jgi:hypothetical protein
MPPALLPDGAVLARVGKHGSSMIVEVRGDQVTELTPAGQEVIAGTVSADGSRWALTIGGPRTPGDLFVFDPATRKSEVLHQPNRWLDEIVLGEVEELWYPSLDGTRNQAWLVKPSPRAGVAPHPTERPPLVLEIHGGPHTAYGFGFFHEHMLAGAGYAVLYSNPRGSTTYGQAFANVIQYRFPGDDARDLMAGVDHLIERADVDAERLGVTGGSGGGLLTNWLVVQTERFKAAVTSCVSDWEGSTTAPTSPCSRHSGSASRLSRMPRISRALAGDVRIADHHAVDGDPQPGGLADADRPGRGHVPGAQAAEEADGDDPLPGREPRTVAKRHAVAESPEPATHPSLVRPLAPEQAGSRIRRLTSMRSARGRDSRARRIRR